MTEAQSALTQQLKKQLVNTAFKFVYSDNIMEIPQRFPICIVDPAYSKTSSYNGGSREPEQHFFDIYVVDSLDNHGKNIARTRSYVSACVNEILKIDYLFASGDIRYGADVIGSKRVCFAQFSVSYPR